MFGTLYSVVSQFNMYCMILIPHWFRKCCGKSVGNQKSAFVRKSLFEYSSVFNVSFFFHLCSLYRFI